MTLSVGVGLAAGYKLALSQENKRLERNKELVRLSHEKVWSEPNTEAAVKAATEIYAPDGAIRKMADHNEENADKSSSSR